MNVNMKVTKPYPYGYKGCKIDKNILFVLDNKSDGSWGIVISKVEYPKSIEWLDNWFKWVDEFGNEFDKEYSEIVKKDL